MTHLMTCAQGVWTAGLLSFRKRVQKIQRTQAFNSRIVK